MNKIINLLFYILLFASLSFAFDANCVGVTDGDTITVLQGTKQVKVRLYGIDCPEKRQPYGKQAKKFTSSVVYGKAVSIDVKDKDRYGRTVAIVYQGKTCLNEELLKNGFAWVYTQYYKGKEWVKIESEAKILKLGLWNDQNSIPPWKWRILKKYNK